MISFYIVLLFYNSYFTTRLRKWLKDSLTYPSKLVTKHVRKGDKFLSQFCLLFRGALWAHFIEPIDSFLILDILLKWFAPILSFTTEEIFRILNKDKNSSIHLETFPNIPSKWRDEKLFQKWEKLKIVRNVANAAIEVKRSIKRNWFELRSKFGNYFE